MSTPTEILGNFTFMRRNWVRFSSTAPPWPRGAKPNPYEIFGMTPHTFNKRQLAKTYIELAKLYHPDRHLASLDSRTCTDRFKHVVEAHGILKDDRQRMQWNIRHNRAGSMSTDAPWAGGYRPGFSPNFHPKPKQEDFDQWSEEQDAKFRASLQENRVFLLKCVAGVSLVVAGIELYLLSQAAEARSRQLDEHSRHVAALHLSALDNYEQGSAQRQRIDRFVAHRQRTIDQQPDRSFKGLTSTSSNTSAPMKPKGSLYVSTSPFVPDEPPVRDQTFEKDR